MDRILVPVDFSDCSRQAIVFARAIAEPEDAEIHLLHVFPAPAIGDADNLTVEVPEVGSVALSELAYQRAERDMRSFADEVEAQDLTTHLLSGSPGRRILDFAEQGNFDLIVMGTHGRTGLQRLIMGSVSEYVVRQASCPVLSIHPRDEVDASSD